MKLIAAAVLLLSTTATALGQAVEIEGLRRDFQACHAIADAKMRLPCYDAMVTKIEKPTFEGKLSEELPFFKVDHATMLRYQSDGPIFVMYLKDEKGAIVQNLHIGGGGESTFLITKPGTYNLQVSGTDTWRVWVEPQAAPGGSRG